MWWIHHAEGHEHRAPFPHCIVQRPDPRDVTFDRRFATAVSHVPREPRRGEGPRGPRVPAPTPQATPNETPATRGPRMLNDARGRESRPLSRSFCGCPRGLRGSATGRGHPPGRPSHGAAWLRLSTRRGARGLRPARKEFCRVHTRSRTRGLVSNWSRLDLKSGPPPADAVGEPGPTVLRGPQHPPCGPRSPDSPCGPGPRADCSELGIFGQIPRRGLQSRRWTADEKSATSTRTGEVP